MRTATLVLALLLIAGCGNAAKTATLCQSNAGKIQVTFARKTGDKPTTSFVQSLPSGTRVTILEDDSGAQTVKIRIEQGEFKGQEATVSRNALRVAE